MIVKKNIFGKLQDKGKEKIISFRVSKETYDLFKPHAESKFGDVSNGLKEIFLDYMSQYPLRRQSLRQCIRIFVPIFKENTNMGNLPYKLDFDDSLISCPDDMEDIENTLLSKEYISDFRKVDLSGWWVEETYNELSGWLSKDTDYALEDGVVIESPLNNFLDDNFEGIYSSGEENPNHHLGLIIFKFEGEYYYIIISFKVFKYNDSFKIRSWSPWMVSNNDAYKIAIDMGNVNLAKFIDKFNKGVSNVETNKQLLIDKKKDLLHQLEVVEDRLSKLDDRKK